MQNGTNCDTNSGNTQCHFVELRGIGHDKSAPTPTESTWKNISTNTTVWRIYHTKSMATNIPQGVGADSSRPFFNPNQMVLMYRNDTNCNAIL